MIEFDDWSWNTNSVNVELGEWAYNHEKHFDVAAQLSSGNDQGVALVYYSLGLTLDILSAYFLHPKRQPSSRWDILISKVF